MGHADWLMKCQTWQAAYHARCEWY